MSNVLDLSVEWSNAKASIDAHNASLKEAINLMPQIAKTFNKPSDAVNVNQKIANTNERIRQTTERLIQSNERLLLSSKKLEQQQERQKQKEIAKLEATTNLYNKTQQQLNQIQSAYNNLAVKKERYNNLTAYEEGRLKTLQNLTERYNNTLKNVDATIGKHTRNVGNYSSATSSLNRSIGIMLTELPNAGISARVFFMSLSNNFAAVKDSISQIISENKKLRAEGQPTVSAFKQIAGSLFSLNSLFYVGITLFTLYGEKMFNWIRGTKENTKAIEEEKKARQEKAKIEQQYYEQQVKYASDEQARSKIMLENAKNVNLPLKERIKNVEELQKRYPDYLGMLSKEEILAGNTANAEYKLNEALMKRALFLAVQDKIIETTKQLADAELRYVETNKKSIQLDNLYDINLQNKTKAKQKYRLVNEQDLSTTKGLEYAVSNSNKTLVTSTSIYQEKTLAIRKQLDLLYKLLNENSKYSNIVREETKAKEDYIKKLREEYLERTKIAELQPKQLEEGFLVKLKEQKKAFEELRDTLSSTSEEYANYQKVVDGLQRSIDLIEDPSKVIKADLSSWENYIKLLKDVETRSEDAKKKTAELEEELKSLFKSIYNGQLSNLGFDSLVPMFDGTFDKMWNTADTFNEKFAVGMKFIGDVAKDTFEFINSQQQANYEAQYQRLEMQKENALLFAGESAVAQKNIEEEYDRRRKEIQRRQAQDQQKIAIFNSLINTAQGVTAALASANIPLAITIGILGAIQTAFIASQKIPQFYKGTKNAPEGIAFTDERGAELHTDKYGNIKDFGSDKGARLKHLNAGDKIYTAEETQRLLFNKDLNNILVKNDIRYSDERTVEEIKSLKEIIKNKPTFAVQIDKRGKAVYEKKNGIRTKILDNVINIKGYDI